MSFDIALDKTTVTAAVVSIVIIVFCVYTLGDHDDVDAMEPQTQTVQVKRVISGNRFKIEPDGSVVLAGVRAPYRSEPLGDDAWDRLGELVGDRRPRLRYGEEKLDKKGRWVAYVFVDGMMINEQIVREGLAFVRLRKGQQRYRDTLLSAQDEARKARRGIWRMRKFTDDPFIGDRKHGCFHRPTCEDVVNIKPADNVSLSGCESAFADGLAPCAACDP